jgi:hypothetical protein
MVHALGAWQSAAVAQGKAHFPYWVLQWCMPQIMSLWQGRASGPGMAIALDEAGAGGAPGGGGG